jgi:hypothetical protein
MRNRTKAAYSKSIRQTKSLKFDDKYPSVGAHGDASSAASIRAVGKIGIHPTAIQVIHPSKIKQYSR